LKHTDISFDFIQRGKSFLGKMVTTYFYFCIFAIHYFL